MKIVQGMILTDRSPSVIWTRCDFSFLFFFFTFLGEKVLGIFAGHYEFAWDTPQQLNDQCYVVYMVARCMRGGENKRDKQQIRQTESQSLAHSGCVWVEG